MACGFGSGPVLVGRGQRGTRGGDIDGDSRKPGRFPEPRPESAWAKRELLRDRAGVKGLGPSCPAARRRVLASQSRPRLPPGEQGSGRGVGHADSGGIWSPGRGAGGAVRGRWRGRLPCAPHEEAGRGRGEAAPLPTSETALTRQSPRKAPRSPASLTRDRFLCQRRAEGEEAEAAEGGAARCGAGCHSAPARGSPARRIPDLAGAPRFSGHPELAAARESRWEGAARAAASSASVGDLG